MKKKTATGNDAAVLRELAKFVESGARPPDDLQARANQAIAQAVACWKMPPKRRGRPATPKSRLAGLIAHVLRRRGMPAEQAYICASEALEISVRFAETGQAEVKTMLGRGTDSLKADKVLSDDLKFVSREIRRIEVEARDAGQPQLQGAQNRLLLVRGSLEPSLFYWPHEQPHEDRNGTPSRTRVFQPPGHDPANHAAIFSRRRTSRWANRRRYGQHVDILVAHGSGWWPSATACYP